MICDCDYCFVDVYLCSVLKKIKESSIVKYWHMGKPDMLIHAAMR